MPPTHPFRGKKTPEDASRHSSGLIIASAKKDDVIYQDCIGTGGNCNGPLDMGETLWDYGKISIAAIPVVLRVFSLLISAMAFMQFEHHRFHHLVFRAEKTPVSPSDHKCSSAYKYAMAVWIQIVQGKFAATGIDCWR